MATVPAVVSGSRTPDVRRWTGISAVAVAITLVFEAVTQFVAGGRPSLLDETALESYFERYADSTLVIAMTDTLLMSALIIFLACFHQLMTTARPDLKWVADIGFGAGLVWVAITVVGDAMSGGAALDAAEGHANATIIRALIEGHMLLFGGIGCVLTALILASAGFLALSSTVLPRWAGFFAYGAAILNLLAIPTIFGGTSETSLFSVGGWANAVLATFPWLLWVIIVGILTIRGQRHHERRRALAGSPAAS